MQYVSTEVACKTLGVHPNTLRRWDKTGLIDCVRAAGGGHRRYNVGAFIDRGRGKTARTRTERETGKPHR